MLFSCGIPNWTVTFRFWSGKGRKMVSEMHFACSVAVQSKRRDSKSEANQRVRNGGASGCSSQSRNAGAEPRTNCWAEGESNHCCILFYTTFYACSVCHSNATVNMPLWFILQLVIDKNDTYIIQATLVSLMLIAVKWHVFLGDLWN